MQTKSTMEYYFTPVRMATIKKKPKKAENNKCCQGCAGI